MVIYLCICVYYFYHISNS